MSLCVCLTFQSQRSRCCAVFLQSNSVADTRVASAEYFSKGGWGSQQQQSPEQIVLVLLTVTLAFLALPSPFFECGQGSSERLLRLAVKSSRQEGEMVPSTTC